MNANSSTSRFKGWHHPYRTVPTHQVVVALVEADCSLEVVDFFRERKVNLASLLQRVLTVGFCFFHVIDHIQESRSAMAVWERGGHLIQLAALPLQLATLHASGKA